MLWDNLEGGMVAVGAGGRFKREGTYVYLCLMHVDVWQEPEMLWASLVAQAEKNLPAMWRPGLDPWVGKIPWRRE